MTATLSSVVIDISNVPIMLFVAHTKYFSCSCTRASSPQVGVFNPRRYILFLLSCMRYSDGNAFKFLSDGNIDMIRYDMIYDMI